MLVLGHCRKFDGILSNENRTNYKRYEAANYNAVEAVSLNSTQSRLLHSGGGYKATKGKEAWQVIKLKAIKLLVAIEYYVIGSRSIFSFSRGRFNELEGLLILPLWVFKEDNIPITTKHGVT
jgi:hypothetical protein